MAAQLRVAILVEVYAVQLEPTAVKLFVEIRLAGLDLAGQSLGLWGCVIGVRNGGEVGSRYLKAEVSISPSLSQSG